VVRCVVNGAGALYLGHASDPSGAALKILVVDDDLDLCGMLSRFLEKHGYVVFSAGDALQALDILRREQIGLVITDLMMPHMDGVGFTEQIKSDPRFANVPVILITAYGPSDRLEEGLRKGVAMTLSKPIEFDKLLTLVRFAE
jgi:two-component system chemotaxis response regulator CheY